MSTLKIVMFPGLDEISYSTESKRPPPTNPMIELMSERSTTSRDQLYTLEQFTSRNVDPEKRKNTNTRQFVCPPILDLSTSKQASGLHPVNTPKRIFNGFFPSKIRTTNTSKNSTGKIKFKQELFEEQVSDSKTSTNQNGSFVGRAGTRVKSEPASWTHKQRPPQRVVYSLRNGSPSPWINRYQLKKTSISLHNAKELKNQSTDNLSRGLSR